MIELLRDQAGNLWFVELNGRPWGSMALSRRQGLEYPAWQARLALEQEFFGWDDYLLRATGLVCRNVGRELMHLLFVLKGAKSKALTKLAFILEHTRKRASHSEGRYVLQLAFRRSERYLLPIVTVRCTTICAGRGSERLWKFLPPVICIRCGLTTESGR